jgi:nicotinamide riboside kinase
MRIGITGAQSVGKTTLLNALRSEPFFKDYAICNEVTRQVKALGFSINEQGNDNTQNIIMLKHLENITLYDNMITDRTALDCLVYTRYLWYKNQVNSTTLSNITNLYLKIIPKYDILFYIDPEFDIEVDGVRSADMTFRDDIVKEFKQIIEEHELYRSFDGKSNRFRYITGSVVSRVQQVMQMVKDIKNER